MELIYLSVNSDYRNLKGLQLTFKGKKGTFVLIGNNGSGKSSILEAISSIFSTLYSGNDTKFEFYYNLTYRIDDHGVTISNSDKGEVYKVDNKVVQRSALAPYLPLQLICNYSGEESRIQDLYYSPHYVRHIETIKNSSGYDLLHMVFLDRSLWKIVLLCMIATRSDYNAFDEFLAKVIGVNNRVRVELKLNEDELSKWGDNTISQYIREVGNCVARDGTIDIKCLNLHNNTAKTIFQNLASARPVISKLKIIIDNGVDSEYLSEGEKKLMVVLFMVEGLSDERSLILLDEPDSHIHVARKTDLVKLFKDIPNRENLLTSHSPTLTSEFDIDSIIMLDKGDDGHSQVVNSGKQELVSKLTDGKWSLQKQNIFLASSNDIVLVEGTSDETILLKALGELQGQHLFVGRKFEFLPCGGADGVCDMRKRFPLKNGQNMYCFFDSDKKGWGSINKIFGKSGADIYDFQNFGLARKDGQIWIAPFPRTKDIPEFNIEDYFPRRIFLSYVLKFRLLNDIFDKDKLKRGIAEDLKNIRTKARGRFTGKDDFKGFAAVFGLIDLMKKADSKGETEVRYCTGKGKQIRIFKKKELSQIISDTNALS